MQIEVGKRYLRRDGGISAVLVKSNGQYYPFRDPVSLQTYDDRGCVLSVREPKSADLVAEYVEPVSPSEVSGKEDVVQYDLSGIPAGYEFVGYRLVQVGDQYLGNVGGDRVYVATASDVTLRKMRIIVKPTTPPEPKKRTVAIHKWLLADRKSKERISFGTAEWVQSCKFKTAIDLGLYEEVEVDV